MPSGPETRLAKGSIGAAQTETGTSYFKSIDGTFAATLLKKYERHFIRYIFEKVPTVPVLGTVIRYFSKKNFAYFGNNIFNFFALNND